MDKKYYTCMRAGCGMLSSPGRRRCFITNVRREEQSAMAALMLDSTFSLREPQ
jgi:hypothetical protein